VKKEKKNKRKAVLKLAKRELLLKGPIQIPHKESAELDLSKRESSQKKSRGFPLPLGDNLESVEERGLDQLREQQVHQNTEVCRRLRRTNWYWLASQPI
jgi:hypothetical protein